MQIKMINQTHYNRNIVLAIKNADNSCSYLQLSPQNYQLDFINFVREQKMSKEQAIELKSLVEEAIYERVIAMRERFSKEEQDVKRQQLEWLRKSNQARKQLAINKKEAEVQTETEVIEKKEKEKENKLAFKNIRDFISNQESSDLYQSPRFNNLQQQKQDHEEIEMANQEDTKPRQTPIMSPFHSKSTEANSPESYKQEKLFSIEQERIPIQKENESWTKKPILLENQIKRKAQDQSKGKEKRLKLNYPQTDPKVHQRLFETQTESFKSKKMEEINYRQELEYYDRVLAMKDPGHRQQLQDMSAKTTQSFRAKLVPESDARQERQRKQYETSFREHLRIRQEQKEFREKMKKLEEKEGKHFEKKGAHCEAKIEREKRRETLQKLKKAAELKEESIRKRIQEEKKQNIYRDLSKRSHSPASKSRCCPSCSPPSKKQIKKKEASTSKSKEKAAQIKSPSNRKYVSNILNESYLQFARQAKQL